MKRAHSILILVAIVAVAALTACAPAKPAAASTPPPIVTSAPAPSARPAAPPAPLSIPQTQVTLPPAQPVPDESLDTEQVPAEPAPAAAPSTRPHPRPTTTPTHPDTTPPPTPVAPPVEPERAPIQEMLPANEQRTLIANVANKRNEARRVLDELKKRRLTSQQTSDVGRARSFLKQSDDAEKRGDIHQADALAELALILARELNGK